MPRTTKQKPLTDEVKAFVKWHLGPDCFAPLTGQDWPAWLAFVHLAQCRQHGGGRIALEAMTGAVLCAQPIHGVLRLFVQVLPAVGNWEDVAELWPTIAEPIWARDRIIHGDGWHDARRIHAWERCVKYDAKHKRIPGSDVIYLHGLEAPPISRLESELQP